MNKTLTNILSDFRFWIIIIFVIRLIGVTNPPLEPAHNWRQTTVAMVARNFLEVDNNICYPRLDIAGEKTGITGMEFPLLNYLIYLLSEVFGYQHWYGRLINLIFSSLGLWYFFMLVIKYFSPKTAFNASLILMFSIWFTYSRKIMPDTFSMSLILASIYYGTNYFQSNSKRALNLCLYFLLATLGMLSKLPSAYLLAIFVLFVFDKKIELSKKITLSFISVLSLTISVSWYFYWVPHLVEKYHFWYFFMGNSIINGAKEITTNIVSALDNFYNAALKYLGFIVFLIGLLYAILKKEKKLLVVFLVSSLSFLFIILKMGVNFPHHSYYVIPFVPIMALLAGYGLDQVKYKNLSLILLIAICSEGLLNRQHDFIIPSKNLTLLTLEAHLDKVSKKEDLILMNSGSSSTPMYFAHRKGWTVLNHEITKEGYIKGLQDIGLKFIVIIKNSANPMVNLNFPISFENQYYCIYEV